ncbi:hypothetical protein [Streptomyces qinglanensis]|uniref:hypothetical protein n=1 Tax=Streptomyces qinglanensis TaxID=943816 RepID=UPI001EF8D374|nr:hypothetical protein [Streptomyces qinglanensis]
MIKGGVKRSLPAIEQRLRQEVRTNHERCPATSDFRHRDEAPFVGASREAETHLEHLAITRKTLTGLAERLPAVPPALPEHPDCPRILGVLNDATGPLRARDVCEALDHELLPKTIEGTRAKRKRLVKLGILTEIDMGSFARRQEPTEAPRPAILPQPHWETDIAS